MFVHSHLYALPGRHWLHPTLAIGHVLASICIANTLAAQPSTPQGGPQVDGSIQQVQAPQWLKPGTPPWPEDVEISEGSVAVTLLVTIDAAGRATKPDLVDPTTPVAFAKAALAFIRDQPFRPAMRGGKPVSARIHVQLTFEPFATIETRNNVALPRSTRPPTNRAPSGLPEPQSLEKLHRGWPWEGQEASSTGDGYGAHASIDIGAKAASESAASDMQFDMGMLRAVPRQNAAQLMTLAPGFVLSNHGGEGHAQGVYLRGFDAGEGKDMEVLVDGIPVNEPSNAHAHGYADTQFVIPEFVESLRIVQGPFDPRQSDFAAAGSAEFHLAAPAAGIRTQASLGSFGRRRFVLGYAPDHENLKKFAAFDVTQGNGFGPNRAHHNIRALAQFTGRALGTKYRFLTASHSLGFDTAGVIRQDALNKGVLSCGGQNVDESYCLHDPNQGGHASRHLASLELIQKSPDRTLSQQFTVMLRASRFRENFTGTLFDERGDGLDQQTDTLTLSTRGSYRTTVQFINTTQHIELGYDARHDRGSSRTLRLRRADQTPYTKVFDNGLALSRIGGYGRLELQATPWLAALAGVRIDGYGYAITARARPDEDLTGSRLPEQATSAFGVNVQPRFTVRVGRIAGLRWLSSFGLGSRSSDAAALSEGESAPFTRIWSGESGALCETDLVDHLKLESRAAVYFAHVDRDMLFDEARGRNVTIGATNRYGAYGHARLRYRKELDVNGSVAWAEAYQPTDGSSVGLETGSRVPFIPRFVVRGDAALRQELRILGYSAGIRESVGGSWISPRPLPLNRFGATQVTIDAAVSADFGVLAVEISGTNLTNRQNHSADYFYASNFDSSLTSARRSRLFAIAPPRRWMLTLTLQIDPPHGARSDITHAHN